MSCRRIDALDEPLRDLWRRRPDLSGEEWSELFRIVVRVLSVQDRSRFDGLPGGPEDYIQDYFEDRVFLGAKPGGEIHHTCALVLFFDRYLNGRRRDPSVRDSASAGAVKGGDDSPPDLLELQTALDAFSEFIEGDRDPVHLRQVLDLVEFALRDSLAGTGAVTNAAEVLDLIADHLGLSVQRLLPSARAFLGGRDTWTGLRDHLWWIKPYLREHFCPEDGLALNALARRYQVPSYHYKAVKLGVTVPKGSEAAQREFATSYLGQWLLSLDIPLDGEHYAEMAIALKMLCVVALIDQDSAAIAA